MLNKSSLNNDAVYSGTSARVDNVEGASTVAIMGSSDKEALRSSGSGSLDKSGSLSHVNDISVTAKHEKGGGEAGEKQSEASGSSDFAEINLDEYRSASSLEKLGLEHLKHALVARGLKCGGSAQQRAERLFSVKGVAPEDYPASLRAKK